MDKSLLLGLPILLCSFREVIQCRMCHLQFPGDSCFKGRGICTVTAEEACVTGRIFKNDGFPWMIFMGCLKNCANVDRVRWGIYVVNFRCCRSHDLCNEPQATVAPTVDPIPM